MTLTLASTHMKTLVSGILLATFFAAVGCGGPSGPPVHQVKGTVEFDGLDPELLSGHNLEVALESDPRVRAFALIQPDGSFVLESLHEGVVYKGAIEGNYKARLVIVDDDPQVTRDLLKKVDPKVLRFETTALAVNVPSKDNVALRITRR
jgi:hypothetical protein